MFLVSKYTHILPSSSKGSPKRSNSQKHILRSDTGSNTSSLQPCLSKSHVDNCKLYKGVKNRLKHLKGVFNSRGMDRTQSMTCLAFFSTACYKQQKLLSIRDQGMKYLCYFLPALELHPTSARQLCQQPISLGWQPPQALYG